MKGLKEHFMDNLNQTMKIHFADYLF